jgi:hypothetical protein
MIVVIGLSAKCSSVIKTNLHTDASYAQDTITEFMSN